MKQSILINQERAIEWGLNLSEACVFAFIYELPIWAYQRPGKAGWYFCSHTKIMEEFPLITEKKDTIYRIIKSLKSKGLIKSELIEGKNWISLTNKGKTYNYTAEEGTGKKSEVGKKSDTLGS